MFDWIIPTLVVVSFLLVLAEVWVRWFSWKKKEPHIYEQLSKTVSRIEDDAHEDEEVLASKHRTEKLEKMNRDK